MAKKNTVLFKLASSEDTGYFLVRKKNPKKLTKKLSFKKYDPVARKHVLFTETKLK
jgi:large subunit ribosomal protein L33